MALDRRKTEEGSNGDQDFVTMEPNIKLEPGSNGDQDFVTTEPNIKLEPGSNGDQDFVTMEPNIKLEPVRKLRNNTPDDCYSDDSEDHVDNGTENSGISALSTSERLDGVVECHRCGRKYKNKRSLSTHVRVKHKVSVGRAKMPCLEKNCNFRCNRIAALISHLIRVHKRKFQCEKVTFQCHADFWNWKKEAEDRCRSSYSSVTSARELISGDKKVFLRCNRSGFTRPSDSNFGASSTKKSSSRKINAVCTSFMDVMFVKEGGAVVHFCRTHYGHKEEDVYTKMNDDERQVIRDLIIEGLTASDVIATMKTRLPVHRHHLLKYANIRNISVRQNLLMRKSKGLSSKSESVVDKDTRDQSLKSGDIAMALKVDNEVEIEAGHILEPESSSSIITNRKQDSEVSGSASSCTIQQLKSEVADKAQKISKLALGLVTEISLSTLNKKLDSILNDIGQVEHIEVIPDIMEYTESCKQISCMFEDIGGNSVSLLCSDKDVHELSNK